MAFLYRSDATRGEVFARLFAQELPNLLFVTDPAAVEFLFTRKAPPGLATGYPNLPLLFSSGAGVDQFAGIALPEGASIVRTLEPGIVQMMQQYVTMAVLALHRGLLACIDRQRKELWQADIVPPATSCRVTLLGLGELGRAASAALAPFGLQIAGWIRTPKEIAGVDCRYRPDGLLALLPRTDILVCMLPLTSETAGILNADLFARLPAGAKLVNVGRGGHLVRDDLLAALDVGRIAAAVLDVTTPGPPPGRNPLWGDLRVLLTPHVARQTQAEGAARSVIENIRQHWRGERPSGLVSPQRGY